MSKYYVYELWNPIKNLPFYVGYCKRRDRPQDHINEAVLPQSENKVGANPHKIYTIRQIYQQQMEVIIKWVFETNSKKAAIDEEIRLISLYGRKDIGTGILTNMTDGGEGTGKKIESEKERQRKRERFLGKTFEEIYGEDKAKEIKEKISSKRKGYKTGRPSWNAGETKETNSSLKKLSQSLQNHTPWNAGKKMSEVEGYVNAFKGKTHSEEFKADLSRRMKGKYLGEKNPRWGKPGASRGKFWYHNETTETYMCSDDPRITQGNFVKGRLPRKRP